MKKYVVYFLILVYVSGAIGFVLNPNFFMPFTPFNLIFTCFVFLIFQPLFEKKYVLTFFLIACIGFSLEVIGVKTGLIFGNYYYGNTLGFKLFDVPLVISLNWALLINAGILVSSYFTASRMYIAILSGLIITLIDLVIEQIASPLTFWHFENGIAGIQNYIAWFIVTFIISILFYPILIKGNKKIATLILALQLFFFGFIYCFKLFNFVTL
jgi:bisanhydrobacterioruberin hydratase